MSPLLPVSGAPGCPMAPHWALLVPLLWALLGPATLASAALSKCGLVIVGAGTPRTGSTHEMKLVHLSLNTLGVHYHESDYWNWPVHAHLPADEAKLWYETERKEWASYTPDDVVLYKSHEYNSTLLTLCAKSLVLLSHPGCIERVLRSVVAAKFIPPDEGWVTGHLDIVLHDFERWSRHATVDISNEALKASPLHTAAIVHHAVALALNRPYAVRDFSKDAKALTDQSNKEIPHRENSAEVNRRIREMVQEGSAVRKHFEGDERLLGWDWSCDIDASG